MAIQHYPTGDRKSYDLIRFFRPTGSQTVVFAQDMGSGRLLRLLRWGSEIYLPVVEGMALGIGVYNGSQVMRGYPFYVEARNLWDGGPSQPEDVGPDHMWELYPGQTQVFDKLVNPLNQSGRPLIIQASGLGITIGEATFGTNEFRGQIRLYEKLQVGGGYQQSRPTNAGNNAEENQPRSESLGFGVPKSPGAGIGAGAEVYQAHSDTGVRYQRNAQPVCYFRVEYQRDLQPMLNVAWANTLWGWYEDMPSGNWWDLPWNWHPGSHTAPEIPVARPRPHNPYR